MLTRHGADAFAPIVHPSVWRADELRAGGEWLVRLTAADIGEIEAAVDAIDNETLRLETVGREDFALPALGPKLQRIRNELLHGRGFVQLRGLPVRALGRRRAAIAFWGIGTHLGDEFASQNQTRASAIGSVARHFDDVDPHTPQQLEAIRIAQELAAELRFDVAFEPGDMQFLHNHVVMHSRQAFEDFDEPERRRHLFRLWLLNHDGRALPDAYYDRHGDRATVRRPGGIVGPHTRLHTPLD